MAISYYVTRLSDNIGHTDEGYLIARDAVIARTGLQEYRLSELPQDEVKALDISGPTDGKIQVYRSPDEVFSTATIGSFEGKPICDGHPGRFLAVDDIPPSGNEPGYYAVRDYQKGHLQNVRRGDEPLDSGEFPLLGDLIITDSGLIQKVDSGLRQVSAGYNYHLARDGDTILQVGILGNHVAVVRNGRAGPEARIDDAAPEALDIVAAPEPVAVALSPEPQEISSTAAAASGETEKPRKEQHKVTNVFKHLLGLGLKAYAADADPEKLSEAVEAVNAAKQESTPRAARANDEEPPEKKAEKAEEKKEEAKDAEPDEKRTRLHGLLDQMMDKKAKRAQDTDMDELKQLMSEFLSEEAEEPEHEEAEADDAKDGEEKEAEEEPEATDHAEGRDSAEFIEPIPMGATKATTSRGNDAITMLRELRPFVARSKDPKLKQAFNTISARANDAAASGKGSYGEFHQAARTVSGAAKDSMTGAAAKDDFQKLQDFYNKQGRLEHLTNSRRVN